MKLLAKKTAKKGKKSVTLKVFSCDNILISADESTNEYKITHVRNFEKANTIFYNRVLQMHEIDIKITLYNN